MLEKILKKFGYLREDHFSSFRDLSKSPFTEDELCFMLAQKMGDVEPVIEQKDEDSIFKRASEVEGLAMLLKETAYRDIRRYFGATNQNEQMIIRGAFSRTNYLRSKIVSGKNPEKIRGVKYAK